MDREETIEEFGFKFCNSLLEDGMSYSSVILSKDNNVLYRYSTNKMWEGLYLETGFSNSCHLIKATRILSNSRNDFVLFWDALVPDNEISIFLNEKRKEKNISHGVSFCKKNNNGVLEILTVAGRTCDINFPNQVIKNKHKIVNNLLKCKKDILK